MTQSIGPASATLTIDSDPPITGRNHAVLTLSGVSPEQLAHTTATFGTTMPAMSMRGPSGSAHQVGSGRWEFDAALGMAAAWNIQVTFSGGVSGSALFHVIVGATSRDMRAKSLGTGSAAGAHGGSMPGMPGMPGSDPAGSIRRTSGMAGSTGHGSSMPGMTGMAGMPGMGDGTSDAWKNAALALLVIVIVGAVAFGWRRRTAGLFIGLAAAAVVVVGLALSQERFFHANPAAAMSGLTSDMSSMADVHGSGPLPVTVARAGGAENLDPVISAPGSVQPYLIQDVVARAPGALSDFTLYAGDRVRAGQVIARLDEPELGSRAVAAAADAQAQRAAAEGASIEAHHHAPNGVIIARDEAGATQRELDAARSDVAAKTEQTRYWRAELAREHELLAAGAVSEQEYTGERAQAASAEAALATAQDHMAGLSRQLHAMQTKIGDAQADVNIMRAKADELQARAVQAGSNAATESTVAAYRNVIAPNDGVILKRMVDPGVFVAAGTVIARIAVIDRLRLQANVSQDQLAGISIGTPLEATLADGRVVHGRVASIQPVADPLTHTATVEAIVENPTHALVPGGFVNVTLRTVDKRVMRATTQVPSNAIVGAGTEAAVWTIVDGAAHRVPVKIVSDDGTTATIEGRVTRGERIAVEGASTLEEGQAVEPRDV